MNLIIRLLVNAFAVFVLAYFLDGVTLDGYLSAIVVAVVLSVLNLFVKPILIILTLPVTFFTLGLFLLVINALIILLADKLIDGFGVSNFWIALLFSVSLSILQSVLHSLLKEKKNN